MALNQDEHHLIAQYISCFALVYTGRLVLCRVRTEDGAAMFAVHGDPATNLYNPSGPDPDSALANIIAHVFSMGHHGLVRFAHCTPTSYLTSPKVGVQ